MKNIAEWIFINTLAFFASLFACLCSTAASESFNSGAVFSLDCSSFSLSSRPIARLKDPTDSFQLVVVFIVVYTMAGQAALAEE